MTEFAVSIQSRQHRFNIQSGDSGSWGNLAPVLTLPKILSIQFKDNEMADFTTPSARIDAAVCNLLARIDNFADSDFETEAVGLKEDELELIVVRLIEEISDNLTGKLLGFYLQIIRQVEEGDKTWLNSPEDAF
ncbi:hypothetical protein C7B61_09685 [filamentous cyanobacterium CCP1]|nr:hypothetical protein C7B76_02025 [filamentous cyanobacterium CCP2]PSB66760.1 hypothetical protein C7B61_09685 [filamentous cyanobacterium CCP1]